MSLPASDTLRNNQLKITILVIGLALAVIVGMQSFLILTSPFASRVLVGPASLGIMIGLLLIIAAAFSMSMLRVSMICFAIAGVVACVAGMSTAFHDLRLWGFVALGLGALSYFANRGAPGSSPPLEFGSYHRPPVGFEPATEMPITARAATTMGSDAAFRPVAASPAAGTDIIERLERLTALRAAGSLSDEEFQSMKSALLPTPTKDP